MLCAKNKRKKAKKPLNKKGKCFINLGPKVSNTPKRKGEIQVLKLHYKRIKGKLV
jgi:hypothetical protein